MESIPSFMTFTVVIKADEVGSSANVPAWKIRGGRERFSVNIEVQFWNQIN